MRLSVSQSQKRYAPKVAGPLAMGYFGAALGDPPALGDPLTDLANVIGGGINPANLISNITFESNLSPPISIDDPLSPSPSSDNSSAAMSLVQPKLTLTIQGVGQPFVVAPWGSPTGNGFTLVAALGLGVLGLAGYGALTLIRKRRS